MQMKGSCLEADILLLLNKPCLKEYFHFWRLNACILGTDLLISNVFEQSLPH